MAFFMLVDKKEDVLFPEFIMQLVEQGFVCSKNQIALLLRNPIYMGKIKLKAFKELKPDTVVLGYDQKVFIDDLHEFIRDTGLTTEVIVSKPFRETLFKSAIIRKALRCI